MSRARGVPGGGRSEHHVSAGGSRIVDRGNGAVEVRMVDMMCLRAAALIAVMSMMGCGGGGGFPDAPPGPDAFVGGTLSLDWSLVKMADGSPVSCDQVGGVTVTLLLRNRAVQGGFTEVFSCGSKTGTTPLVPIGTYDVNFE